MSAPTLGGMVRLPRSEPPMWWLPQDDGPVGDVGDSVLVQVLPTEEQVIPLLLPKTGHRIAVEVGLTVAQVAPCGLVQPVVYAGIFRCPHHAQPRWHAIVADAHSLGSTGHLFGAHGRPRASARRAAADACDMAEVVRRRMVTVARSLVAGQVGHA